MSESNRSLPPAPANKSLIPATSEASFQKLRRALWPLSRKKKGGSNRKKAKVRVQRLQARIRNKRRAHRHKEALSLINRYGLIAVERLSIRGMVGNHRLSRAISDVAWGGFVTTLKHKAESAGALVIEVNPAGTSQECSGCGETSAKNLSKRWHRCPHRGLSLRRDVNAARNILKRAFTAPGAGAWALTESLHSVAQEALCFS